MKPNNLAPPWRLFAAAGIALIGATAHAQTVSVDFDDPADANYVLIDNFIFDNPGIAGNAELRPSGGQGDTVEEIRGSGYLAITDALNSQRGVVIFPDVTGGAPVAEFNIKVDIRTGGGTASPADGFSFNFVRPSDPVLADGTTFAGTLDIGGTEPSLPEEGTRTGVAIGFDEWFSGGTDTIGMSVRVDGDMITQVPYPTLNGAVDDTTSLQTGEFGGETSLFTEIDDQFTAEWDVIGLKWATLEIDLDADSILTITYKDQVVLQQAVPWFPTAGQIVVGGRTGGANAMHHLDNLSVTTTAATTAAVSNLAANACGFIVQITDAAESILDQGSVAVTLNGDPVTVSFEKNGNVTDVIYEVPLPAGPLLPVGDHQISITAKDNNGNDVNADRQVTVAPYTVLDAAWAAAGGSVDTNVEGHRARMRQQLGAREGFGDQNSFAASEAQLTGRTIDPFTGLPFENDADLTLAGPDGVFVQQDTPFNYDQDGNSVGIFPGDVPFPGILTGDPNNFAGEFSGWMDLAAGCYEFSVNSDDGFDFAVGGLALDVIDRLTAGQFSGGRGQDGTGTLFRLAVPVGGLYPFRLSWWEGGGGANLELLEIKSDGTRVVVGDNLDPASIKTYPNGDRVPHVRSAVPGVGATGVLPPTEILLQITDGTDTLVDGSVGVTLGGTALSVLVERDPVEASVAHVTATVPDLLPAGSTQTVGVTYTDSAGGTRDATYEFTVVDYASLDPALASPVGSGGAPGWFGFIHQADWLFELGLGGGAINANWDTRHQLIGLYGPNQLDPATPLDPGITAGANPGEFLLDEMVNFDQAGAAIGSIQGGELFFPFTPGPVGGDGVDQTAARFNGWFEFPDAGVYILGVNSDDNFEMTEGHDPLVATLTVNTPGDLAGPLLAWPSIAGTPQGVIGAPLPVPPLTAPLVVGDPILGDAPLTNAAEADGAVVLLNRGGIPFTEKVLAAQNAGAVAVLIATNVADIPIIMGGDPPSATGITIPALMITQDDGAALEAAAGVEVTISGQTKKVLGEFNNGRGAADTTFAVNVPEPGIYPISTIWHEAGGGANIEIFSVVAGTGEKVLINDPLNPASIKSFQNVGGGGGGDDFAISSVSRDSVTGEITVVFESADGVDYFIDVSTDLETWVEAGDTTGAGSETTVVLTPGDIAGAGIAVDGQVYVRVRK